MATESKYDDPSSGKGLTVLVGRRESIPLTVEPAYRLAIPSVVAAEGTLADYLKHVSINSDRVVAMLNASAADVSLRMPITFVVAPEPMNDLLATKIRRVATLIAGTHTTTVVGTKSFYVAPKPETTPLLFVVRQRDPMELYNTVRAALEARDAAHLLDVSATTRLLAVLAKPEIATFTISRSVRRVGTVVLRSAQVLTPSLLTAPSSVVTLIRSGLSDTEEE